MDTNRSNAPSGAGVLTKQEQLDLLEQKGTTCCYAKADKFWVRDADGMPWEMYSMIADAETETAADQTCLPLPIGHDRTVPLAGIPRVQGAGRR